ncbi:MAG: Rne/Rng family ribonuclease [Candidatus Omnitrophota bacterium]|nr:Rne/Rng family ribonuclease [Candidatus Omnitrophota bacterium]
MTKEILINVEPQEKRVAIIENAQLEEFYLERPQDRTIVGNIYKGKVEAVVSSIGAAFVDIGLPKKGFLYLSEISETFEPVEENKVIKNIEVKTGQEVLVQVVKESFGTKGPRLSTHIGLPGRYLVLMPQDAHLGISRRIENEAERKRLKQILVELKLPKDVGFILRTAAVGKSKRELWRDARFLIKLWARVKKVNQRRTTPGLVYEEYDLVLRAIRDYFTEDVSKLIIDSKDEFRRIRHFMNTFLGYLAKRVELYKGYDLFKDRDIERQINKIFENKVYLKSKVYLVIEQTEGLVVIDVNSGGFKKSKNPEEMAFKVNSEAAIEIARQLRLRNLGGIIVIDFIDMEREGHRQGVFDILNKELSKDKAKYDVLGISKFGVVEMTRERIHRTTTMLSYQECPYCKGKGRVKSPLTISIYALKELRRFLSERPDMRSLNIILNPSVYQEVFKEKLTLTAIERRFKAKINLLSDPALHIEDIKIS